MTDRDYVTEMRTLIDKEAEGEYVSGLVAAEIVGKLQANDLDLLNGWLHLQAVSLVHHAINDRDRSRRTQARTGAARSVFASAAEAHAAGDSAPLRGLLDTHYVVNGEALRKPLASMTAADLRYVSGRYEERMHDARLEMAFFAALAKKVGQGVVSDHFTEDQLHAMRASLRAG